MEKGLKLIVLLCFKTVLQPCEPAFSGGSQQLEQFQAFSCKVRHCMKMPNLSTGVKTSLTKPMRS